MTVHMHPSVAAKEAEKKAKTAEAAQIITSHLNSISYYSVRVQAAESVGLYTIAEGLREKMEKHKAALKPYADVMEGANRPRH